MQTIINILVFILIFSSIIIIHEFGHLLMAKFFNVYCPKYSFGFGPVLLHKQFHETDYELRAIPFGGFVMMAGSGDDTYEYEVSKDRLLTSKKTYQKILIYLAGVLSNFVTAIIVMVIVFSNTAIVSTNSNKIGSFTNDSVLKASGLAVDDAITSIYVKENDQTYKINQFTDIDLTKDTIGQYDAIHITVQYIHDNEKLSTNCTVQYNNDYSKYILGISEKLIKPTFIEAIQYTFKEFIYLATIIIKSFISLFTHFTTTVKQFSGPVGIYNQTSSITSTGEISTIFYFWSLLCINIGVFNLIPIPGLDGYQVIIELIETLIHKEIPQNIKENLTLIGISFLIILTLITTFQDLF